MPELRLRARAGSPGELGRDSSVGFDTTISIPATDGEVAGAAGRLPAGTTLRRYVLLERVGAGAMGVVYAAYDYGLDRKVAIKLLREARSGTAHRRRLMREAQALARLSHPNVVAVHDLGSHGEQVFVAMEYVDGRTLRRWLAEEPRSLREVLAVFRAAGEGLAAAHAAGIVHRDFKPDNVLVDRHGRARVSDFGLASLTHAPEEPAGATAGGPPASERHDDGGALTRTGMLFGTPAYMALEQHLRRRVVDPRADQFSFAVALYESACGVHPFEADTPAQIAENIRHGRIQEPRRRVPRWLVRALLPALAADPERRYPSMDALLRELRDRRPARIAAVGVAAAAVGLFVAGGMFATSCGAAEPSGGEATVVPSCQDAQRELDGVWDAARRQQLAKAFHRTGAPFADERWTRLGDDLDRYADDWTRLRIEVCQSARAGLGPTALESDLRFQCLDRRREDLRAFVGALGHVDREQLQAGIDTQILRPIESCADGAGLQHEVQPPDAAAQVIDELRARERRLRAQLATGRVADALPDGRALVADADKLGYAPVQAEARLTLAGLHWAHGDFAAAEATLHEAVRTAEAGRAHRLAAQALLELMWMVGEEQGRYTGAVQYAQFARGKLAALEADAHLEALLEDGEGVLLLKQKQLARARQHLERGRALYEKLHGPDSHQVAASLEHLGLLAEAERRFDDAAELFQRARQIAERVHGLPHSATLTFLAEEARALLRAGRPDEALATNRRGLELVEEEDLVGVMFLANLGRIEHARGRLAVARGHLARALAITVQLRGPDHVYVADAAIDLGLVLEAMGRLPDAAAHFARAAAIFEHSFGPAHPDLASALLHCGRAHLASGKPASAVPPLERALSLRAQAAASADELAELRSLLDRARRTR